MEHVFYFSALIWIYMTVLRNMNFILVCLLVICSASLGQVPTQELRPILGLELNGTAMLLALSSLIGRQWGQLEGARFM